MNWSDRLGEEAIRQNISQTSVSDMLELAACWKKVAKLDGGKLVQIVPLFETIEDLIIQKKPWEVNDPSDCQTLDASINNHRRFMLGYLTSNKDGGYLSSADSL